MEQITYAGPRTLERRDVAEPALQSDAEAIVRPLAVATCDLDALIIAGVSPFQPPFALGLGVIDVKSDDVETVDAVAARVRRALNYLPAEKLVVNPDCGLRHLAPDVAYAKLQALAQGAALVREELS